MEGQCEIDRKEQLSEKSIPRVQVDLTVRPEERRTLTGYL